MAPHKLVENVVILCFERCFSKQNSVIRLKSSNLAPPKYLAPPKFLGLLRHCAQPLVFDETLAQPDFAVVNCSDIVLSVFYSPVLMRSLILLQL